MESLVAPFSGPPPLPARSPLHQHSDFPLQHGAKTPSLKTWNDPAHNIKQITDYFRNGKAAKCSKRSIVNISNNLRRFGNVRAPLTRVGRRRSVTPRMLEALYDHLLEKPGLYVDEMAVFLWDEFRV
jgi:hypothetical protein